MSVDAALKRYWPAVICAAIAMAAYFQASGIGDIVASAVGNNAPEKPSVARGGVMPAERVNGNAILARNPFDSETGPLDGSQPEPKEEQDPAADGDPTDSEPKCDFGRVLLIAASEDPEWSFASLQGKSGGSQLRRVGDDFDGHKVEALTWDRVWLANGASRCQMQVGDKSNAPAAKKAASRKRPSRPASKRGQLPDELASKIHKVSDTEYRIERSVVDDIIDKQAELMRYTRVKPIKDGDKVTGLGLSRIREGTLLHALGLQDNDQIVSINGFELTNPQRALEAYGRLRTADQLKLEIIRNGSPTTIDYNIQ
jgi:general secretion pathway protein C